MMFLQAAAEPVSAFQIAISAFTAANAVGVGILAFRAGSYARQIDTNTKRLDTLESKGSPQVQVLSAALQTRLDGISEQVQSVQKIIVDHISHKGD